MKHTKKRLLRWFLALLLLGAAGFGGWTWYDNNIDRSGWREKDGITLYTDFHGKPVTGWLEIDGSRYYFGSDYAPHTGWLEDSGNFHYFDPDGKMRTGWLETGEGRYYLDENGIRLSSWQQVDGGKYYFNEAGQMQTGWLELETGLHYLNGNGTLHTGWLSESGRALYLDGMGTPVTGWQEIQGLRYCFDDTGTMLTGWQDLGQDRFYFSDTGALHTGWLEEGGETYYFHDSGAMACGWTEADGKRYYFSDTGAMHRGWLEEGECCYYLLPDGTPATGPREIDGVTHYFTPKGIRVLLVNPKNPLRPDYTPELVEIEDGWLVDRAAYDALSRMLQDLRAAGFCPAFSSTYRNEAEQQAVWDSYVERYMAQGLTEGEALSVTARYVAVPGTSEHHTGLAMDIVGCDYFGGEHPGSTMAVQQWLAEHCWEYGFILRYTAEKQSITGFAPETWHFRYVGTEVSLDMKDSGLCLEEYLGAA